MNELGKLISSLLLLGAGFFAASFVGPPEVVDRLARYLKPSGEVDESGLQPLPAATVAGGADRWPSLPGPPAEAAPAPQDDRAGNESTPGRIAPVAARVASTSWSESNERREEPADWPTLQPPPRDATPAEDPWLTAATLGAAEPAPARSAVTPIPRRGLSVAAPSAEPSVTALPEPLAEASGWPSLEPPRRDSPPFDSTGPNAPSVDPITPATPKPFTSLRPTLDTSPYGADSPESPYGDRPRFDPTADAYSSTSNPLRYEPSYPKTEAIARQVIAPRYGEHIVTDGDTLALLAERYLGDASRARELFELNTDRLEEPDVLPIGLVLRTPDRPRRLPRPAPPAESGFPTLDRPDGFATLAASGAGQSLTRDPFPIERRPLTSASTDPESIRPAEPPTEPLYDHDVMWDPGRW